MGNCVETNFKHRRSLLNLRHRLFFVLGQAILLDVMFVDVETPRLFIDGYVHFPDFLYASFCRDHGGEKRHLLYASTSIPFMFNRLRLEAIP